MLFVFLVYELCFECLLGAYLGHNAACTGRLRNTGTHVVLENVLETDVYRSRELWASIDTVLPA